MNRLAIFDIYGTLANTTNRLDDDCYRTTIAGAPAMLSEIASDGLAGRRSHE